MSREEVSAKRVAEILLAACGVLFVLVLVLGAAWIHLLRSEPSLEQLSADDRMHLVEEVRRVAPPLYEPFPGLPSPGFYRFAPSRRYDGSHPLAGPVGFFRDHFTANELGFRAISPTKSSGVRRIVLVGDSWVFASGVSHEASFGQQLAALLNRGSEAGSWEVFNLGMMGWNLENELTALRVLGPWLQPDYVIFCPTSNDIDDPFEVWNGTLVHGSFQSGGIFRRSYEVERRWIEAFRRLDEESRRLATEGVPSFLYFLAEWRKLSPYYAQKAELHATHAVVPEAFILDPYLLSVEQDPGRHPNEEGHRRIAGYLYDALIQLGWASGHERIEAAFPIPMPAPSLDLDAVNAEFDLWRRFVRVDTPGVGEDGLFGHERILTAPNQRGATHVVIGLELLPAPTLYPLRIEARVLGPNAPAIGVTFERYAERIRTLEVEIPDGLDEYEFLELRLTSDRVVSLAPRILPVAARVSSLRVEASR